MPAEFVRRHIAFPRLSCLPGRAGWTAHEQDGREAGTVNEQELRAAVTQAAEELAVPGVAVGVSVG